MKQLTQAIFSGQPSWVKSAAVDSNGKAHLYGCKKRYLSPKHYVPRRYSYWYLKAGCSLPVFLNFRSELIGDGFDATDWKRSAINRVL